MNICESNSFVEYKIDEDAGIIYNVKVLGEESQNGFAYPKALRQTLTNIHDMNVNINHNKKNNPSKDVPLEARFGQLKNPKVEDDGTYADLHYLKSHPMASMIVEAAKRMPKTLGLSIFAKGSDKGRKNKNGKIIIESCSVSSVDLVADPATVRSLFESENIMDIEPVEVKEDNSALLAELELLKAEKACRVLCESCDIAVDSHLMNVLTKLDENTRKEHLQYIKRKSVVKPVISTGQIDIVSPEKNVNWADKLRNS